MNPKRTGLLHGFCLAFLLLFLGSSRPVLADADQNTTGSTLKFEKAIQISAGTYHTCLLDQLGDVWCWGGNSSGQLGDGTTTEKDQPVPVVSLDENVRAIAAGYEHTCAVTEGGSVFCWGAGEVGGPEGESTCGVRLFIYPCNLLPVEVRGFGGPVATLATGGVHCALLESHKVQCWGDNLNGQLGNESEEVSSSVPVDVVGLPNDVKSIVAGANHTCALSESGNVFCWGSNLSGNLGDGTESVRRSAVEVTSLENHIQAITAGSQHTCAVTATGVVKCWGDNHFGQLGIGEATNEANPIPVAVANIPEQVQSLAAGAYNTCALTASGAVACWGGVLIDENKPPLPGGTPLPAIVTGLESGVISIAMGGSHACVLTTFGAVKCWGEDTFGQLGDGLEAPLYRSRPFFVAGFAAAPILFLPQIVNNAGGSIPTD